jgi:hypothetical protein
MPRFRILLVLGVFAVLAAVQDHSAVLLAQNASETK